MQSLCQCQLSLLWVCAPVLTVLQGLDDINTVYDLTASDACQYFALVEARARAQAPAGAAEERRALYPGDKTMLALHALEEPLRLSSPLVTTAMKPSERHKLEEAYHDIFKAAGECNDILCHMVFTQSCMQSTDHLAYACKVSQHV